MTTAYTSLLGLALPVQGELTGVWGDTVNNSITSLLDTSVAGTTNVSTDTDVTLTTTTGAANTARQAILLFSGARTALRTVTAPAQSKIYTVINATTGGFSVKLVGVGPTTGLTIPNGASAVVAWNGSDFVEVGAGSIGNLVVNGTLTVTGATTLQSTLAVTGNITNTAGTANGVTYLNGSKVLTSGSALTFDGTNFATTGSGTLKNLLFSGGTLPAAGNPSIALRSSDNVIYHQSGSANTIVLLDSAQNTMQSIGATANIFNISNSEAMRLTSTGLGIGTSSPTQKLEVAGNMYINTSGNPYLQIKTSGSGNNPYIRMQADTNYWDIQSTFSNTNDDLLFQYNGTALLDLDKNGNLGLGVTPSAWVSGDTILQVKAGSSTTSLWGRSNTGRLITNAYFDGSNYRYVATAAATIFENNVSGGYVWAIAPSGSAGAIPSFTSAMTLDASGNLLVGTTTLSSGNGVNARANINSSTDSAMLYLKGKDSTKSSVVAVEAPGQWVAYMTANGNSSGAWSGIPAGAFGLTIASPQPMVFATDSTERARITSGGAVCIGTTSVTGLRLNVVGGQNLSYWEGSSSSTNITSGTPDQFICKINNSTVGNFWQTRFLNNAGNTMFSMGAQTTSHTANYNNGKFFVDGGVRATPETFIVDTTNEYSYFGYSSSNGAYRIQVNGQIFATSSTIATSDGRYKENVQDLTGALDLVKALRPVSFNWKKHNIHVFNTEDTTVGFIAQEVQQAMADKPYLNSFIKLNKCTSFDQVEQKYSDEEFLGLAETNMVAILTKALQELNAKFDAYVASHP